MDESPSPAAVEEASEQLAKVAPYKRPKVGEMTARRIRRLVNKNAGINTYLEQKAPPAYHQAPKRPFKMAEAKEICRVLAVSVNSLIGICREHPEFPPYSTIKQWTANRPKFADMMARAREHQAEYIAQTCLDLAQTATKENAHAVRIKFDIARWYASKLLPAVYGDKPSDVKVTNTVQIAISGERLEDIRSRLESTRTLMSKTESKPRSELPRAPNTLTNGQSNPKIEEIT